MARDWEAQLREWGHAPGPAEQTKMEDTESQIRAAITAHPRLKLRNVQVASQGSYHNLTHIPRESDVDIRVVSHDAVYIDWSWVDPRGNTDEAVRATLHTRFGIPSRPAPYGTLAWQRFVHDALADLISHPPTPSEPILPLTAPDAVKLAVERACNGSYARFAEAIQMSLGAVSLWKDGHRRPTIKAALRICAVAGFRLPDFLAGRLDRLEASSPPERAPYVPPSGETHHPHDRQAVLTHLQRAVRQNPAPTLASVQRDLHIHQQALARLYPKQHRRIIKRHEAWVEKRKLASRADHVRLVLAAIAKLDASGRYPSRYQVQRLLPSAAGLRQAMLSELWKEELVRLGYPRPDKPKRRVGVV